MGKAWLFKVTKANGRQGNHPAKKEATHMNTTHDTPDTEGIQETAYNRAQRRAAIKAARGRTAPASNHSRKILRDPITYAREGASLLPAHQRQRIISPARAAAEAMRLGKYTYRHWQHIVTWINILSAINDKGTITQLPPYLAKIEAATRAIYHRASGADARTDQHPARWHPTALWHNELDAVRLLIDLATFALQTVSLREYEAAYALAIARIKTERGIVADKDAA